ncbi:aldo/keto reductase [Ohtaekwangia koreensis]|uniref:Predicted oxidoreductase n=1 Tax=Ohtaekwangia koreensis TaxID=688867 RepID=A0A1T5IQ09_9BACT|nr:aldo/keto reductase [Ohtaekwangia koreensis]SKC41250.1 Predicted oxidoreductase [Ohtaekwangia koreensis]
MDLKKIGNSSVQVTPMAFGAWAVGGWMWGGAEESAALRAIRASFDLGMTTIDTAPVYGFGRSEELVGRALQGIPRDQYQILTKYGLNWETAEGEFYFDTTDNNGKALKVYRYAAAAKVIKECEDSLRRLKTDYIDLLQIHWSDATTPIEETMRAVVKLIEQGKVRAAGVCNYSTTQVDEALKVVKLASNQVPYSMINRGIEKDIVPQALQKGMSIIPYSPLQRGLLSGKIKPGHKFGEGDTRENNKFYTTENINRANALLEKIKPIADGHNASLSQLVINWTTRQPAMDCVLVGARDEQQVKENVKALDFKLSDEELKKITQAANEFMLAE